MAPPSAHVVLAAVALLTAGAAAFRAGGCSFNVNSGVLPSPEPLFLLPSGSLDVNGYLQPDNSGNIDLAPGDKILVACPGKKVGSFSSEVIAECNTGTTFVVNNGKVDLAELKCSQNPTHNASYTGEKCGQNGRGRVAEIGHETSRGFVVLFEALAFDYIANNSDYYLARGHLVAKADFVWAQPQRATFYYINAAPQWQTFNGGNWERLESSVRKLAAAREHDLLVITGTWGRAELPDVKGKATELFINSNGLIPVPALYWKVVYDSLTGEGAAFVGVNNPYTTLADDPRLVLCKDVCASFDWLLWAASSVKAGEGYCCEVDDLRAAIPDIPALKVTSLLAKA